MRDWLNATEENWSDLQNNEITAVFTSQDSLIFIQRRSNRKIKFEVIKMETNAYVRKVYDNLESMSEQVLKEKIDFSFRS